MLEVPLVNPSPNPVVLIGYVEKAECFWIKVASEIPWSELEMVRSCFRMTYLPLMPNGMYSCSPAKIYETLMWIRYYNIQMALMPETEKYLVLNYPSELRFFRNPEPIEAVMLMPPKAEYQAQGIKFLTSRNRAIMADGTGLGKTYQMIAAMAYLHNYCGVKQFLILTKNSLTFHWLKEILRFTNQFEEDDIAIIDNNNKHQFFSPHKKIFIISNLHIADAIYSYRKDGAKKKKSKKRVQWSDKLIKLDDVWMPGKRCLIMDEVHEFNNPESIKSKALHSILCQFEYRYLITATPAINHFYKWYGIIKLLDESFFPYSYQVFSLYVAQTIGDQYNPYKVVKYNAQIVKKIEEALSPYIIKRSKHEVPMNTTQTTKAVYFRLPMMVKSLYEVMSKKEFHVFQNEQYKKKNMMTAFPYTLQILDNPLLLRDKVIDREIQNYLDDIEFENDPRVIYLDAFMKELTEAGEKLIIYDIHPQTLNMLAEHFQQYHPITIHGESKLSGKEKEDFLDRFRNQNDPCKLILLSAQSMSTGVNLQQGASKIVFFSLPNDALLVGQGMERVWRITSENDSLVLFFIFDKTFDTYRYFRVKRRIEYNDTSFTRTFSESEIEGLLNGIESSPE